MGNEVCFNHGCPICGRSLRIPVNLLGARVYCQHCGGGFTALENTVGVEPHGRGAQQRDRVVDDLLERASRELATQAHRDG